MEMRWLAKRVDRSSICAKVNSSSIVLTATRSGIESAIASRTSATVIGRAAVVAVFWVTRTGSPLERVLVQRFPINGSPSPSAGTLHARAIRDWQPRHLRMVPRSVGGHARVEGQERGDEGAGRREAARRVGNGGGNKC